MELLKQSEYNISYFDGKSARLKHNAGYDSYEQGVMFQNIYETFQKIIDFKGKKVLELGCAKGFLIEILRKNNIEAYGLDWSKYAILQASDLVKEYVYQASLPQSLFNKSDNEFDIIISSNFLSCLGEEDLKILIKECNRVSKKQCHLVAERAVKTYYNSKEMNEWIKLGWKKGTIITNLYGKYLTK